MENQTTAPAQGKMERKYSAMYSNRQPIMLSHYELSMVIMGVSEELKAWERLAKAATTDEQKYDTLEIKLHRAELLERLEKLREELFPLPF